MKTPSMFRVILLVVFGALAVAGVLVFSLMVGGSTTATIGPVKIWGTLDEAAFAVVLRQAAENNPQLSQISYEQKDADTYESTITNALANGEGPDLFMLRQDQVLANAGKAYVIPFDTYPRAQFEGTFLDAATPFYTDKGVVGVPLFADPLVLYWNKDVFASGGYAQPPKYWDELFDIAQKVSLKDDTGSITRSAIALGEYQNIPNAKDILATLILQAGGTITTHDDTGKLISSLLQSEGSSGQPTVSALRFYTEFANPSKEIYTWNRSFPSAQRAFASGDLALYIGYASEDPLIRRSNSNLSYGVAALPQIRSNTTSLDTARVYGLVASRTGKNIANAVTAAFMIAAADIDGPLAAELGMSSARRDLAAKTGDGNTTLFNKQAIIAHSWLDPDPGRTAEVFRAMIENTTSGALLINEAVQRADQELTQILGI